MGAAKRTHATASQVRNILDLRIIPTPGFVSSPDNANQLTPEKGTPFRETRKKACWSHSASAADHSTIT
jgi:hypothetical protein